MHHLKFNLGHIAAGTTVTVELDKQANVHLVDSYNYARYTRGLNYRGYGGRQVKSPAQLRVESSGNWFVAIDLDGRADAVRAAVSTIN